MRMFYMLKEVIRVLYRRERENKRIQSPANVIETKEPSPFNESTITLYERRIIISEKITLTIGYY